ncbi:F-box only protein 42 [Venturia canescens]|uniref:F-box only protein 42 n=1 Tax=Venturia canescens TaxID=32260 RepID=UPI001C9BC6FC|nr:F-box only protein 42 [Venturia canescens]
MQCEIDDLPDEILEYILNLIPPYKDLQECMLVCKRWCRVARNMLEHKEAHFQKFVAYGSLYWNSCPLIHQHHHPISKRHSHSACAHENSMWVFGGCTATCTTFNDLWRLDLHSREWIRPVPLGSYPSPKACATMLFHNNKLILFGGWSHPSPFPHHQQVNLFDELHKYCTKSNTWAAINTLGGPPPMSAHSATIHGNLMVVFGGVCKTNVSNDIWCLNLDTYCWHKQTTSDTKPHPRYGQSQIKISEKHLLVLGGCAGPNDAMNDVWLLTMEGISWTWKKVNIRNAQWAPTIIWCHQSCKVGNYVIVLGIKKRQIRASDMSISTKMACQRPVTAQAQVPVPRKERQNHQPLIDRDENVNGRQGLFRRYSPIVPEANVPVSRPPPAPTESHVPLMRSLSSPAERSVSIMRAPNFPTEPSGQHLRTLTSPSSPTEPFFQSYPPILRLPCIDNHFSMAAFRDEPVRNDPSLNRQRQLESLRRMEERIQSRRNNHQRVAKKRENTLAIFVLDITKVLYEERIASWVKLKQNDRTAPDERILYSLVLGRGELIVFGGIRKEQATIQGQTDTDDSEVFNELYFLNPPRYII